MTETLNRAKLGGAPAGGSEWSICRGCGAIIYVKRLIRNLRSVLTAAGTARSPRPSG